MSSSKPYTFTVLGATGFTARHIIEEIAQSKKLPTNFHWAIAGRNGAALQEIRASMKRYMIGLPDVIIVDVNKYEELLGIAKKSRVVMNCVGPFRLLGPPVVKACIEGNANYLDITGEPEFIEGTHLNFHDAAVKAGVTITHAVGFDAIPTEIGVLEMKKALQARGAIPNQIDLFCEFHTTGKFGVNYTTFSAAVHGFSAGFPALMKIREEMAKVRPTPVPYGPPAPHKSGLLSSIRDERVKGWLVPCFVSDPSIVALTQSIDVYLTTPPGKSSEHENKLNASPPPPVHFNYYFVIPALSTWILFHIYFFTFLWLVQRSWGIRLLLDHPKFFTHGVATKEGPSKTQLAQSSFTQKIFGQGYRKSQSGSDETITVSAQIKGAEVGYRVTPLLFVNGALAMLRLEDKNQLRRGALTTAVVFRDANLFADIKDDERFEWDIDG